MRCETGVCGFELECLKVCRCLSAVAGLRCVLVRMLLKKMLNSGFEVCEEDRKKIGREGRWGGFCARQTSDDSLDNRVPVKLFSR